MAVSPTQKTKQWFYKQKLHCDVTERWNPFARIRQDLFNFIDIIAINQGIWGIQATSFANTLARAKKSEANPVLKEWLKFAHFAVWGWKGGGRRVIEFSLDKEGNIVKSDFFVETKPSKK